MNRHLSRTFRSAAAAFGLVLAAGCSSQDSLPLSTEPAFSPALGTIGPLGTSFILQDGGTGAFTDGVANVNNSLRFTTEFWDNPSADAITGASLCNIGHFVLGQLTSATCYNYRQLNTPPAAGDFTGGTYWGDTQSGTPNQSSNPGQSPAPFMFTGSGGSSYSVKLLVTVKNNVEQDRITQVGYFTRSAGGVYTFSDPFQLNLNAGAYDDSYGNGDVVTFTPGQDFGLYVATSQNDDEARYCGTRQATIPLDASGGTITKTLYIHCSDAKGNFSNIYKDGSGAVIPDANTGDPYQHFALFKNSSSDRFIIGMETASVRGLDGCSSSICAEYSSARDSDFNDVMIELVPPVTLPNQGRFTGGGIWTDVGGYGKVTIGFTLHCDNFLSNNLQINWGKDKWHLTKESLTEIECGTDFSPNPPRAPVNYIKAKAVGRWFNGDTKSWTENVPVYFELYDRGEPSNKKGQDTNPDAFRVQFSPGGPSLSFPVTAIRGGNIQAHYDQPHGFNWNRTP